MTQHLLQNSPASFEPAKQAATPNYWSCQSRKDLASKEDKIRAWDADADGWALECREARLQQRLRGVLPAIQPHVHPRCAGGFSKFGDVKQSLDAAGGLRRKRCGNRGGGRARQLLCVVR